MFNGKNVLVIGGTGTIGKALVKKLILYNPKVVRVISRDEYKQFEMANEMKDHDNIRFLLGDVRDYTRLERAMENIDIVFHSAALKHVPSCEYNPFEAVKTNVIGTQNVVEAAIANNVKTVVFTSTDKTINPTNTYGATKLLAERLVSSADYYKGGRDTVFAAVRFGNVMGSRGSVIPLFKKQILEDRCITVTNHGMSRFMMLLSQAVNLTLEAFRRAAGGEIFVLKMPVVNLQDLAEVVVEEMCRKHNINRKEVCIKTSGLRPGEKMYEELMTADESLRAVEFVDMFAIPPVYGYSNIGYDGGKPAKHRNYSSKGQKPVSREELRALLLSEDLI